MMSEAIETLAPEEMLSQEDIEAQLPKPVGYRVLVALPQVEETFGDTGLLKSTTTMSQEHIMSIIGLVLDMGDQAYSDEERFPSGPWCKPGDYVMFRMNTGTRFKVGGVEYRLMNDDSIEAIVADPRGVTRA
jgi:co-chaperonin GroES (HSP10)